MCYDDMMRGVRCVGIVVCTTVGCVCICMGCVVCRFKGERLFLSSVSSFLGFEFSGNFHVYDFRLGT